MMIANPINAYELSTAEKNREEREVEEKANTTLLQVFENAKKSEKAKIRVEEETTSCTHSYIE